MGMAWRRWEFRDPGANAKEKPARQAGCGGGSGGQRGFQGCVFLFGRSNLSLRVKSQSRHLWSLGNIEQLHLSSFDSLYLFPMLHRESRHKQTIFEKNFLNNFYYLFPSFLPFLTSFAFSLLSSHFVFLSFAPSPTPPALLFPPPLLLLLLLLSPLFSSLLNI